MTGRRVPKPKVTITRVYLVDCDQAHRHASAKHPGENVFS